VRAAGAVFRALAFALALSAGSTFAQTGAAAPQERIAFKQDEGEFASLMWRVVVAMGVIAIAGVGAVYLLKRYGLAPIGSTSGPGGTLRVIQSVRLAPRVGLFVVQFGASRVLIAASDQGVSVLATEQAREPAAGQAAPVEPS